MIDLQALDNFAKDHLRYEADCARCFLNPSFSTPPTDPEVLCALHRIRTLVMAGSVDEAFQVCQKLCARTIEDPRVQLDVKIHKLFELLHNAESLPKDKSAQYNLAMQDALRYSQQLAEYALNAFPEAYTQFQESMMLFAYPEQTSTPEAIHSRRSKLAESLASLARMTARARESCFSFIMRYLLLIYLQFKAPIVTPGEQVDPLNETIEELVGFEQSSVERTSRITWKIDGDRPTMFGGRADYDEGDVQTLPERVCISRQDAIDSLRFTNGDVLNALKNELGMILVNRQRFRIMVVEYCAARGLEVFETGNNTDMWNIDSPYPLLSKDKNRIVIPEQDLNPTVLERFAGMCKLRKLAESGDFDSFLQTVRQVDTALLDRTPELAFRLGQGKMLECIRQGEFQAAVDILQSNLGPLAKQFPEFLPLLTDIITLLVFAKDLDAIQDAARPKTDAKPAESGDEKEGQAQRSRSRDETRCDSHVKGNCVDSSCAEEVETGEAMSFEEFLAKAFWSVHDNASLESIVSEVYSALEEKFEEPQLVQLLKRLLEAHEEWQTQSMMKDKFSSELGIDEVKGKMAEGSESILKRGEKRMDTEGGESGQVEEGEREGGERSRREQQRESIILTLMEFLAMSRAQAVAAVRSHPHADNAQSIMDSLLGTMM